MVQNILLVDFGSTYTKFTAVDITNNQLLARLNLPTTHKNGVLHCLKQGQETLLEQAQLLHFDELLCSSSAWGGFRMIAIGLTESLTAEAAKRAALGAGTRLIQTYAYRLTKEMILDIAEQDVDIILLCGGTNGGNQDILLHNARLLKRFLKKGTLLIAGNEEALPSIKQTLNDSSLTVYYTKNVMPKVNVLQVEPVRKIAREIFMQKIIKTNGIEQVAKLADLPIIPTPTAVLLATQLLADGLPTLDGIGPSLLIDIGGATTDVFTIGNPSIERDDIFFEGMTEPYAKRTVEGDLGMRYSAQSLIEAVGIENMQALLTCQKSELIDAINRRTAQPTMIATSTFEKNIDTLLGLKATEIAVNRHAGTLRSSRTPNRTLYYQKGKDLTTFKNVIGTGGVLVHHPKPRTILKAAEKTDNTHLKPLSPNFYLDKDYLFSALGLLSQKYPAVALKLLKKSLYTC